MKKNLIALAMTLTISAGVAAQAATVVYTDINGNWAQTDITNLTDLKIMSGFNDGMFHPDAWLTRSEFINMNARAIGLPQNKVNQVSVFKDINGNQWNFTKVEDQALITAYPSGVFRPENPIRRAEVMASLAASINKPLVSQSEADQILSKFDDANEVPATLRRQVATAIKYDLVEIDPKFGTDELDPMRPATRAEVAAMLNELYDNRDIAIVQNGVLVTSAPVTTTTTTTTATSTGATTPGETGETIGGAGYDEVNQGASRLTSDVTPFRNSADTLEETHQFPAIGLKDAGIQPTTTTVSLPANTTFTGTVAKALYSEFNHPGDPVMLILDHALFDASGRVVAPAGSKILGHVTSVLPHNQTNTQAELAMVFDQIITPTGQRLTINGTVANNDGILRAESLQGIVIHPGQSTAALKREISTAEGALYGIKNGKMNVLEEPLTTLGSEQPLALTDMSRKEIIVGVGDRLQVRIDGTVGVPVMGQ